MSVIGKMSVNECPVFDAGQKVILGVVCEDVFMAHYHPENENVVFTKYSPSGEGQLHLATAQDFPKGKRSYNQPNGDRVEYETACELYLIYIKQPDRPSIDGAAFFSKLRVASRTEYGGDSRTIELCNPYEYHHKDYPFHEIEARQINLKLGIDNPFASDQFVPGEGGWWVVAYHADQMTKTEALARVHGTFANPES